MKVLVLLPLCLSLATAWYLPQWGHPQVEQWLLIWLVYQTISKDNVSHNSTLHANVTRVDTQRES